MYIYKRHIFNYFQRPKKVISRVLMSVFRFIVQNNGQIITRGIKLPVEKALSCVSIGDENVVIFL